MPQQNEEEEEKEKTRLEREKRRGGEHIKNKIKHDEIEEQNKLHVRNTTFAGEKQEGFDTKDGKTKETAQRETKNLERILHGTKDKRRKLKNQYGKSLREDGKMICENSVHIVSFTTLPAYEENGRREVTQFEDSYHDDEFKTQREMMLCNMKDIPAVSNINDEFCTQVECSYPVNVRFRTDCIECKSDDENHLNDDTSLLGYILERKYFQAVRMVGNVSRYLCEISDKSDKHNVKNEMLHTQSLERCSNLLKDMGEHYAIESAEKYCLSTTKGSEHNGARSETLHGELNDLNSAYRNNSNEELQDRIQPTRCFLCDEDDHIETDITCNKSNMFETNNNKTHKQSVKQCEMFYFMNNNLKWMNLAAINHNLNSSFVIINFKEILNFTKTKNDSGMSSFCFHFGLNYTNSNVILIYSCDSDSFSDNLISNINLILFSATMKYSLGYVLLVFASSILISKTYFYISLFTNTFNNNITSSIHRNEISNHYFQYHNSISNVPLFVNKNEKLITELNFQFQQYFPRATRLSCIIHEWKFNWDVVSEENCAFSTMLFSFLQQLTLNFISPWKIKQNVFQNVISKQKIFFKQNILNPHLEHNEISSLCFVNMECSLELVDGTIGPSPCHVSHSCYSYYCCCFCVSPDRVITFLFCSTLLATFTHIFFVVRLVSVQFPALSSRQREVICSAKRVVIYYVGEKNRGGGGGGPASSSQGRVAEIHFVVNRFPLTAYNTHVIAALYHTTLMFYNTHVYCTQLILCFHHYNDLNGSWTQNKNVHIWKMDGSEFINTFEMKRASVIRKTQKNPLLSERNAGTNHHTLQNIKAQNVLDLKSSIITKERPSIFNDAKNNVCKIKETGDLRTLERTMKNDVHKIKDTRSLETLDIISETPAQTAQKLCHIPSNSIEINIKHNKGLSSNKHETKSQNCSNSMRSTPDIVDKTNLQNETQTNLNVSKLKPCDTETKVDNGAIQIFNKELSRDIVLPANKKKGTYNLETRHNSLHNSTSETNGDVEWRPKDFSAYKPCCAITMNRTSNLLAKSLRKLFHCVSNLIIFHIFLTTIFIKPTLANDLMVTVSHPDNLTTTSTSSTTVKDEVTVKDTLTDRTNMSFIPWERNICDDYYRKHQQIVTGRSTDISLNLTHPLFRTTNGIHPGVTYQVLLRAINPQVMDLSLTSLIQNKPSGTLLGVSTHCIDVNATVSSRIYEQKTLAFNFSLSHASVNIGLHNVTFRLRYRVRGTSQVMFETHLIFPISRDCEFILWPNRGNVSWSDMGLSLYANKWTNQCKLVFPAISSHNLTSESGLLIKLTRLYIPCNQGYLEFSNHTTLSPPPNSTSSSSTQANLHFTPSTPSKTSSTNKICGKLEEINENDREFYFSPNAGQYSPQLLITGECVFSLTYHFVDHCYNTSITQFNESVVLYTSNGLLQCNFYILQQYGYKINLTILVWSQNETNDIPSFDNDTMTNPLLSNDTSGPLSSDSECNGLLIRMFETGTSTLGKCIQNNETSTKLNIVSRENKIQLKILAKNFIHKWIHIIYETLAIDHIVQNCNLGSIAVRQFCLQLVDSIKLSWPEAESECVKRAGHLASIRSAYTQSMIDKMLLSSVYYADDNAYWVGATDYAHEGDYRWTDALSFSYSNWFPGWPQYGNYNKQPNDDGLSRQDCVELRRTYHLPPSVSQAVASPRTTPTYMWNDRDCTTKNFFICETAIATNLQVPDRKTADCNRTITLSHEQPRALITSPGFPRAYPDNAKCNTLISALPGYRVVLHFEEFVLEPEPHCSYDYLIISEDNITRRDNTRRLCGDWSDKLKLLRYVSKTAQVRLAFISDYSHHYSGFKARISMEHVLMECADSRLHMFNTSCYLFVSYPQVTWYTASDICRGLEGELASIHSIDEHRFIVSKLRESKEYSTSAFYWMGGTLDRQNKWKWIDNTHMDFTAWLPKSTSYVVLDGQSSSCLSIQWMLSVNPLHSSGLYWSPQRCQIVGGYVCKKENLENPVNANTSLSGTDGFITSPGFPANYANNLDYWVNIRGPEETRIVLAFLRLDLEPQSECLYDYVEMYHSGSLTPPTRLCGNHHISQLTQLNFVSENNEATLRFHSDYSVSASGFSIQWRAVDVSGCPIQLLTAREGVIYSPNYPHFLLAHLDCTFTVLAPAGRRVWLEIVDYSLEDVYDQNLLQEASLTLSLGAGTPTFRPYVNQALLSDGAYLSFGERLELRLRTGASPTGRGFKANYKIVNSVDEERVVHLYNGTGMILRHLNFPAPPPGLSLSYNQRLVAPLGYCIQLVFYQTIPALCMDLLDTGPGCATNNSSTTVPMIEVKDSYAELNGTWWKLCEAQGGYAPPLTIVSYLNSIHVKQLSTTASQFGTRLNVSVSLRQDYNYKSKLLRGSSDTGVESCQPNPCQNGGKCFSNGARSFCQCVGHYTGMLCALTMCELEPCLFGTCELTPIGYKCHCQEGYKGVTCDVRIRPCDTNPCNGHGMCVEKSDRRYQCRCYAWWKGENCSERIMHIPQTPLAERMLQEPFWLGLITVTVVLLVLGMFWCARRHFPDKLEKLLAEENERNRHHYPSASSSRSQLSHSHHHCVHTHSCSHPMGHIPVPTTGAPPNSPHSSTRSLFTKIRRKASILSLTSPIIGGSSKKLSAQAGGGPTSSPRAFSLDDLVKSSIAMQSRTPSPRKRRNNSTPTKNKTESEEIFKKLAKKPSSDDSNFQETCFSVGSDVNLKDKKVVTFATIEQPIPPSEADTNPSTNDSNPDTNPSATEMSSSTSTTSNIIAPSRVRTRVSSSKNMPPLRGRLSSGQNSASSNLGSDSLSSSDLALPTLTESDIVRPLTLAACSADSILAMFRNFSTSLPSQTGGGGMNRSSALVSATTSPTCTSPQASDDSCTPYSSSSNLMESPTFGTRKPSISIQVPVMDQKSMNSNPGPTILLEVPSCNKGGLSPIHEVPTPALTPVMQRHTIHSNAQQSDTSDVSVSSDPHHPPTRRPHHLIIPKVTIESPSPTSPKFPPPHLLGSPPPHRRCFNNSDFEADNFLSISQYGGGPPVITVTGTMSEAESDDTEVGGKGGGGGGGGGVRRRGKWRD
uniref:Cubilin n=1 Tax=Cacopsylla melanoneura TaxID=428564 RepID=A0A8D8UV33_9HEMI